MKIKPTVYKELSNKQRAEASLDAILRGDKKEAARLIESCAQKTYQQADHEFTELLFDHVFSSHLKPTDKLEAIIEALRLTKGTEEAGVNMTVTVVHQRSADWPPEDIADGEIVSDEFIKTRGS